MSSQAPGGGPDAYSREILAHMKEQTRLLKIIAEAMGQPARSSASAGQGGYSSSRGGNDEEKVADDRDLDGSHGDPMIKFDPKPKYWSGRSYAGFKFSETEPDYLDAMAKYMGACAYMASQDPDEAKRSKAKYKSLDAARARGWAARLRNGWKGAAPATSANGGGGGSGGEWTEEDVPFASCSMRHDLARWGI